MEEEGDIVHFVALCAIAPEEKDKVTLPAEVQAVLDEFQVVFTEPTELPKHRAWDHPITLLPDTKPVNIRLYRYTP